MTKINAAILVIFLIIIAGCFISVRITEAKIDKTIEKLNAVQSELITANAEIERLNGVIGKFKEYNEKQNKAEIKHLDRIVESEGTISEKINSVESNPDACNWLDEPLPMCVQKQFNTAGRDNSGTGKAANDTIEVLRKAEGWNDGN